MQTRQRGGDMRRMYEVFSKLITQRYRVLQGLKRIQNRACGSSWRARRPWCVFQVVLVWNARGKRRHERMLFDLGLNLRVPHTRRSFPRFSKRIISLSWHEGWSFKSSSGKTHARAPLLFGRGEEEWCPHNLYVLSLRVQKSRGAVASKCNSFLKVRARQKDIIVSPHMLLLSTPRRHTNPHTWMAYQMFEIGVEQLNGQTSTWRSGFFQRILCMILERVILHHVLACVISARGGKRIERDMRSNSVAFWKEVEDEERHVCIPWLVLDRGRRETFRAFLLFLDKE
jgi:hypothetical protein